MNVYLPDDLARAVKDADLNVSALTQRALVEALETRALTVWLHEVGRLPPTGADRAAVAAAVAAARSSEGAGG